MVEYDLLSGDGIRYERIGNSLLITPSPRPGREEIADLIYSLILRHLDEHPIGRVFVAPCVVRIGGSELTDPDVLFISNQSAAVSKARKMIGPPDFIAEIRSDQRIRESDLQRRVQYEQGGVREWWIVNMDPFTIRTFVLVGRRMVRKDYSDGTVNSVAIKGFSVRPTELRGQIAKLYR